MKKNKMMRAASFLLVAVLLTTSVISGTFAKYVSTATAADTARVAKWKIMVNDTEELSVASPTVTFDLFNTVTDVGGLSDDSDVKNGTGTEVIIAPGTAGSFDLKIENMSEVTAKYAIDFTVLTNNGIPVQYSIDGTNWYMDINYIDIVASDATKLDMAGGSDPTETVKVQWKWAFEADAVSSVGDTQNDAKDTALGIAADNATPGAEPKVEIQATITVTQVD